MTTSNVAQSDTLTPKMVMRRAMLLWLVLLLLCAFSLGVAFCMVLFNDQREPGPISDTWFVISAVMLGFVVPMCLMAHWGLFRKYWKDGLVQPRGYFMAYCVLWAGLTLTAIVIAISVVQRQTLMPDLTLAAPTMMLLMVSWPAGWAMTHRTQYKYEDDAEVMHLQENDA